jgi:3-oxoadipate enol-lactonase
MPLVAPGSAAPAGARPGYAAANGLQVHYLQQGEGPTVVCLHGLGSSAADWQYQLPILARHYRVIAPDLRAHGQSPAPHGSLTVQAMAADVAALLDELKAAPAHLVGLSLGGCVAQMLALRHPAHVRSLTLVNTFARLQPAGWRGARRLLKRLGLLCSAPMATNAAYIAEGLFPKPDQAPYRAAAIASLCQNSRRTYLAAIRAILAFDVRAQLADLHCPTLIIAGDRDTTVGLAAKQELQRLIPGARLVVAADSGHATPYDQMDFFNRTVMDFLAEIAPV